MQPIDLVLEDGGNGIGLAGVVHGLEKAGLRPDLRCRVAGASAGAVAGALIAAGVPADELEALLRAAPIGEWPENGPPASLHSHRGDPLHQWLTRELGRLGVRTFGDLRIANDPDSALPPECAYRLVVAVSDRSRGRVLRLPWDYHQLGLYPDEQPVADAVRASVAALATVPVDLFDRRDGRAARWPTVGVRMAPPRPVWGLFELSRALITTMVVGAGDDRTIHIDPSGDPFANGVRAACEYAGRAIREPLVCG